MKSKNNAVLVYTFLIMLKLAELFTLSLPNICHVHCNLPIFPELNSCHDGTCIHGMCHTDGFKSYHCVCDDGYEGLLCQDGEKHTC